MNHWLYGVNGAAFNASATLVPTGLVCRLEARLETGYDDNDPVGTMTDQAGSNDFTQAGADSVKPVYKTGAVNGNPAYYFDGGDSVSNGDDPFAALTSEFDVFAVVKLDADSGSQGLWVMGTGGGIAWYPFSGADVYENCGITSHRPNADPGNLAAWHCHRVLCSSGAAWAAEHNGTQFLTQAGVTVDFPSTVSLGTNGSGLLTGHIAMLAVYDHKLSASDLADVETYINAYYGITFA